MSRTHGIVLCIVESTLAVCLRKWDHLSVSQDLLLVMLFMFVILFVIGMFIDFVANILIMGPLLMPLALEIGMDPVHFGIWFMFTLTIGFITPPYGFNFFVVSSISGESVLKISRRIAPFLIAVLLANIIIAAVPQLSTWIIAGN